MKAVAAAINALHYKEWHINKIILASNKFIQFIAFIKKKH